MTSLFIINDAPYGSEKAYNALRMAMMVQKEHPNTEARIFLMAYAVTCGVRNQTTPQGYYNIERMLRGIIGKSAQVKAYGTCCQARGIQESVLIDGVEISTMSQLTIWTVEADKVLTF